MSETTTAAERDFQIRQILLFFSDGTGMYETIMGKEPEVESGLLDKIKGEFEALSGSRGSFRHDGLQVFLFGQNRLRMAVITEGEGFEGNAVGNVLEYSLKKLDYAASPNYGRASTFTVDRKMSELTSRIIPEDFYLKRSVQDRILNDMQERNTGLFVVKGESGIGKTNLLFRLAVTLLMKNEIVIFAPVEHLIIGTESLEAQILNEVGWEGSFNALVRELGKTGNVNILLDTLDRAAYDDRKLEELLRLISDVKGDTRVFGTTRPAEYFRLRGRLKLAGIPYELDRLTEDEMERLIELYEKYFPLKANIRTENGELHSKIREVCSNPLHLKMLFEGYAFGGNVVEINLENFSFRTLYERFYDVKVRDVENRAGWCAGTAAGADIDRGEVIKGNEELIGKMCCFMFRNGSLSIPDTVIPKRFRVSESVLKSEGIVRDTGGNYEFFHQSFFEFSASRWFMIGEKWRELYKEARNPVNRAIVEYFVLDCRGENVVKKFLKRLVSGDISIQMLAVDILGKLDYGRIEFDGEIPGFYRKMSRGSVGIREYLAENLVTEGDRYWKEKLEILEELATKKSLGTRVSSRFEDNYVEAKVYSVISIKRMTRLGTDAKEAAEKLIEKLTGDKDSRVGYAAGEALEELLMANLAWVKPLIEKLTDDKDSRVGYAAGEALKELVKADPALAKTFIEKLTGNKDSKVRRWTGRALKEPVKTYPAWAKPLIEKLTWDKDSSVREAAGEALKELAKTDPESAKPLIEKLTKDKDWRVQEAAGKALKELVEADPAWVKSLIEKLTDDKDSSVREAAGEVLEELVEADPAWAKPLIKKLTRDKDSNVRWQTREALKELVKADPAWAIPLIEKLTDDKDWYVWLWTGGALKELVEADPAWVKSLIEKLTRDEDSYVRETASKALKELVKIDPEGALQLARKMMKSKYSEIRAAGREVWNELADFRKFEKFSQEKTRLQRALSTHSLMDTAEISGGILLLTISLVFPSWRGILIRWGNDLNGLQAGIMITLSFLLSLVLPYLTRKVKFLSGKHNLTPYYLFNNAVLCNVIGAGVIFLFLTLWGGYSSDAYNQENMLKYIASFLWLVVLGGVLANEKDILKQGRKDTPEDCFAESAGVE